MCLVLFIVESGLQSPQMAMQYPKYERLGFMG